MSAAVGEDAVGIDQSGDGISELGFFVADAVAADHRAVRFHHFREAAGENLLQHFEIATGGEAYVGQRGDGASAHGVYVAQGIGGGDLAEGVGVVDDGREEIDSLHQRDIGGDFVDAGIIGMIEADQTFGSCCRGSFPRTLSRTAGLSLEAQPPALTVSVSRVLSSGMRTL